MLAGYFALKLCERQRIFYGSRSRLSLIEECSRKGGLIMGQGKNNRKKRDNQVEDGNGQVRQQDDEAKKLEKEIEEKELVVGGVEPVVCGGNEKERTFS